MSSTKHLSENVTARSMMVDLGTRVLGDPEHHIELSLDLHDVGQVWLTGFYVRNCSAEKLKVDIQGNGFHLDDTITNSTIQGRGLFLVAPIAATGARIDLSTPLTVLPRHTRLNTCNRLRFRVTDFATADVSWSTLVLFFVVQEGTWAPHFSHTNPADKVYDGTF